MAGQLMKNLEQTFNNRMHVPGKVAERNSTTALTFSGLVEIPMSETTYSRNLTLGQTNLPFVGLSLSPAC